MRYYEIAEQIGPVGAATQTTPPAAGSGITGNVGALAGPNMQAAMVAQQQQQKQNQKKQIQDQINQLKKQVTDLTTQLSQIK